MGITITEVLNTWDSYGVFSYVLPFLIIFAVVFGILQKSAIFGTEDKAKGINAVLAVAIGLTSLQFDFVSTFFATIFPRFGVWLSVLLVMIIMLGLFVPLNNGIFKWSSIIIALAVIIWSFFSWDFGGNGFGAGIWFKDHFWSIIILVAIVGGIVAVMKSGKS